jgi:ABC-2 type transport system permease protein
MFARLAWTEMKLTLREPIVLVFALVFPLILLYLLLNSFGTQPAAEYGGVSPTDYYVPAYAAGVIVATCLLGIPVHLAAYRERGVLNRLRSSGIPAWSVLVAQTLVTAAVVTLGAIVLVVLGFLSFDLTAPASWPGVVVGFGLSILAFVALGFLLGSLLPTARAAQAVGLLFFFSMFFISGGGPPESLIPAGVTAVADVMPMRYAVTLVQDAWWSGSWHWSSSIVLAGMLAGAAFLGVRRLNRPES